MEKFPLFFQNNLCLYSIHPLLWLTRTVLLHVWNPYGKIAARTAHIVHGLPVGCRKFHCRSPLFRCGPAAQQVQIAPKNSADSSDVQREILSLQGLLAQLDEKLSVNRGRLQRAEEQVELARNGINEVMKPPLKISENKLPEYMRQLSYYNAEVAALKVEAEALITHKNSLQKRLEQLQQQGRS